MKNTFLLSILAVLSLTATAQKSNLVFFAENGEKFTIIMNGLKYNETPATNVKLTDLQTNVYKVRAIFEDPSLGMVTKTIQLEPYVEYTFNIRPKKETAVGGTVKRMGNQVSRDLGGKDSTEVKNDKETYVMRFVSEVPLATPLPPQQQVVVAPPVQQVIVGQPGTVTQTTTTTVRSSGTQPVTPGGAAVNMSVNDPDMGVNFNMNIAVPTDNVVVTGNTVQQTTTTTTYGGATTQPAQYVMPGYNGPIGCPWPMDQNAFNSATTTINGQSFEDNKLQVAQQVFISNCMTSAQVTQIMKLFSFEDSRLTFAKFAYRHTYDIGNYFQVNNAFTFSSSVDELNAYIHSNGR